METYLPEGSSLSRMPANEGDAMRAVIAASEAPYPTDNYYQEPDAQTRYDAPVQPTPSRPVTPTTYSDPSNLPVVRPQRDSAPPPPAQQRPAVLRREPAQPTNSAPPQPIIQRQPSAPTPTSPPPSPTTYGTPPPADTFGTPPRQTPPDLFAILRSHEERAQEEAGNNPPQSDASPPAIQRRPATSAERPSAPVQPSQPTARASTPPPISRGDAYTNNEEAPVIRRRAHIEESTPYQRAMAAQNASTASTSNEEDASPYDSIGFDPDSEPDDDDYESDYTNPNEVESVAPTITPKSDPTPPVQAKRADNPPVENRPQQSITPTSAPPEIASRNDEIVQSIVNQAIPPILQTRRTPDNPPAEQVGNDAPPPVKDAFEPLASKSQPVQPQNSSAEQQIRRRPLPHFNDTTQAPDVGELPVEDRLDLPTIDDDDGQTEQVTYEDNEPVRRISNSPFTYYAAPTQMPQDAPPVHPRGDVVRRKPQPDGEIRQSQPADLPVQMMGIDTPRRQTVQREADTADANPFTMPHFDGGDEIEEESSIVRLRRIAQEHAQRAADEGQSESGQGRSDAASSSEPQQRPPEADLLQLLNLPPDTPIAGLNRNNAIQRAPATESDDSPNIQSVPLDVALMGGNFADPIQRDAPAAISPNPPAHQEAAQSDDSQGGEGEDGDLNVDSLARDVLKRLRQRLRIEQERRSKK